MRFSAWGEQLGHGTAIEALMDDLGRALAAGGGQSLMLGGGNPALIPAMLDAFRARMAEMLADGEALDRVFGVYDPPQGQARFVDAMRAVLARHLGREVPAGQLAVTAGGQAACFALFNLLAGEASDGSLRRVLLPLVPEYIGYADQGFARDMFRTQQPRIERTGPQRFRYGIDWERLTVADDVALIAVSRPTNPSGNLLAEDEVLRLAALAAERGVPLLVDNAYGLPFPQILHEPAQMIDAPNLIQTFSLSKVGLPGVRNGIVLAPESLASRVTSVVAVSGLANPNLGQAIVAPLLESGELERLSTEVIAPYYAAKLQTAVAALDAALAGVDYALHEAGGALFLWLWLPSLRITSYELYERLKARGVIVVPGEPFFYGLPSEDDAWPHRHQCVRISFAMPEDVVLRGIESIADEVRRWC